MKIDMKCHECGKENKVELNEEFILEFTCKYCNSSDRVELGLEKYHVLFDLGIICLKRGYYKEAVSDFATALERMFEFSIKCMLRKNNIESKTIESIWKEVKNQSERQYGAFVFLYAREFNKVFKLDTNKISFRNNVIHKGMFPNFNDTYDYAKYVYNNIYCILVTLLENGYLDNYNMKKSSDETLNVDAYSSFIHHFRITDDQKGELKPIPDFDDLYKEFYKNNRLDVPKG